ncbi:MAG: HD domain-containing protein [Bacteroidales bacterium]
MESGKIQSSYRSLLRAAKATVDPEDISKIRKALDLTANTCGDNNVITGESQLLHSLSVARIIAGEMGLGVTSIVTALLHDSYDRTGLTRKELEREFGKKAVEILDGFSRVSGIDTMQSSYQAENFRKLLLSLADDVRVILIKLVERLEYMRNLDNASEKEKIPFASETYFLYAPLAHRLGFYNIKSEMEDLSIKFLEPEQYYFIEGRLKQTAASRNRLIRNLRHRYRKSLRSITLYS